MDSTAEFQKVWEALKEAGTYIVPAVKALASVAMTLFRALANLIGDILKNA
jgi:hypothetical protein